MFATAMSSGLNTADGLNMEVKLSASRLGHLTSGERALNTTEQKAGWALQPIWPPPQNQTPYSSVVHPGL